MIVSTLIAELGCHGSPTKVPGGTGAATAPGAPTAVAATAGDAQATISWQAPVSDGGGAITGYTVTSTPGSFTATISETTATITGLANGTSYAFTVHATNAIGNGPESAPSNAVTPTSSTAVPGAPTSVSATAGVRSAVVSWTAPASTGGAAIISYRVTPIAGGTSGTAATVDGTMTSTEVTGLENGTSYTVAVEAVNHVGAGPAAMSSTVTTAGTQATVPNLNSPQSDTSTGPPANADGSSVESRPSSPATPLGVPSATSSVVQFLPSQTYANAEVQVTVWVRDRSWSPMANASISLETSGAAAKLLRSWGTTDSNGSFQTLITPSQVGTVTVTATLPGGVKIKGDLTVQPSPACQGTVTFPLLPTTPAGQGPDAEVAADFNKDGKLDVMVANSDGHVSVLLGRGNGTFLPATSIATVFAPTALVTGDFNGDQKLDVVAVGSGGVALLVGAGDGSFQVKSIATSPAYTAVTAGDFNGDGTLDLALVNASGTVDVMLGAGDGTFSAKLSGLAAGNNALAVANADVDGNQKLDLLTIDSDGKLNVLSGAGNGTFVAPMTYAVVDRASSLTLADFNKDGVIDALVTNSTGDYVIMQGHRDGSFTVVTQALAAGSFASAAVEDVDHDGNLDLILADPAGNSISVQLGKGNFSFLPYGSLQGVPTKHVVVGDFNGDSKLDVAATAPTDNALSMWLGQGNGSFVTVPSATDGTRDPLASVVEDFDQDGYRDLAVTEAGNQLVVSRGYGAAFVGSNTFTTGDNPVALVSGDFNEDGKPDLVVGNDGDSTVGVYLGNGDLTFQANPPFPVGVAPVGLAVADLNGDSHLDLLVEDGADSRFAVLLGNGDGTFTVGTPVAFATQAPSVTPLVPTSVRRPFVATDLNGDNVTDLAFANNWDGKVYVLLGNGDGTFQEPVPTSFAISGWLVVAGDFNGDGTPDLATVNDSVALLTGNGDGTFRQLPAQALGVSGVTDVTTGDFDGDGHLDLACSTDKPEGGSATLLPGQGDGTFKGPFAYLMGYGAHGITSADLDYNGRTDLVVDSVMVEVLGNQCL